MKTVSVGDSRFDIEAVLDTSQTERVVVIRAGKPSAVIVGIESYDAEDLALASSPEFWRMIDDRRQGRSISLAQLKKRLKARERKEATRQNNGGVQRSGKLRRRKV